MKRTNYKNFPSSKTSKRNLWEAAIKWPLYSVAIMPLILATGWRINMGHNIRLGQLAGFFFASILLLIWENLTNDLFDADTGIDAINKPHSLVALMGKKLPIQIMAYSALLLGLGLIALLALRSNVSVLYLVLGCCGLGYIYQGPPFRLGYQGLGEPLCWLAFGPLATAAGIIVISPTQEFHSSIPWSTAITLGSGPAIATTLVLFCSHFHQIKEDAAHGKKSPLVRLGAKKSAHLVPWLIGATLFLEWINILNGDWPITALLSSIGIPSALSLIKLLKKDYNKPNKLINSKFLALRFQALNGLGLSAGLAISPILSNNFFKPI